MKDIVVDDRRLYYLNSCKMPPEGSVIYWMSREQRIDDNWSLLHAADLAGRGNYRLVVVFTLWPELFGETARSFDFLIGGLKEVYKRSCELNIAFRVFSGSEPYKMIRQYSQQVQAAAVVCDFNPLRESMQQQKALAAELSIPVIEVDSHNIVPCRYISGKQEFGAHTLRRRIEAVLSGFMAPFPAVEDVLAGIKTSAGLPGNEPDWEEIAIRYNADKTIPAVNGLIPGSEQGLKTLYSFIENGLGKYSEDRNDPNKNGQSGLSPYLHFGQVAPQTAALEAAGFLGEISLKGGFLDELVVRRELSDNFCLYNPDYDNIKGFPSWAVHSLGVHSLDRREYLYSFSRFEQAETHEDLWNAAQLQLVNTGRMHGYMRMYWAKKILEWSHDASEAMRTAVKLNDRYSIDGNDPNGYAGCAWAIGGLHDRAWGERAVFGKIRYMNESGCKRKFDTKTYIRNHLNKV